METLAVLDASSLNPPNKDLEAIPLVDDDALITDFVAPRDHLKTYCQLRNTHSAGSDLYGIWQSNLPTYFLPSVNVFPEIIHLCAENYDQDLRAVKSPSGSILFYITPESIDQMLNYSSNRQLYPFTIDFLLDVGSRLSDQDIKIIARKFMKAECQPSGPPPFLYKDFNEVGQLLIDMLTSVLGLTTNEHVDTAVLVMLSAYSPGQIPEIKYNYARHIAIKIHDQLSRLKREGIFKYSSYIYHMFLYYQTDSFQCSVRKLDSKGERRSVIFWSSIFHQVQDSPYSYCEFVDQFAYPVICLLKRTPPARLSRDMQKILQLSRTYKIGDWYFYQNHTVIRIYGCELCPYRLPRYVPMRLFALEYYRQLINSDLTHFHSAKKKANLKFRDHLGPFTMNKKDGWQEADQMLEQLKLKKSFWWVPYDPEGFISARRVKFRLKPYDHSPLPQVQPFANQEEWMPGTIVEELSQEELMEQTVKDLEKTLDLDSCQQVFKPITQTEEITSAIPHIQEAPATSAKGKEKMDEHQESEIGQASTTEDQQTTQAPPLQTEQLQTPLNTERGKKRDREEVTPPAGSVQQPEAKRPRTDPEAEGEISEELESSQNRERQASRPTTNSTINPEQQRTVEVSSSRQQVQKPPSVKEGFMEIKAQNELLRVQLYQQFLDTTPAKKQRLMAAFDLKDEKMIFTHLKPKVPHPKNPEDYYKTNLEIFAKDIHPMDQIELHKQTGEMVYATLADRAMLAHQLKESLKNTNRQLDLERLSSSAKDNRIKTLEDIIVEQGYNPKDLKGAKALMKKKEDDIAALRRQAKLPPTIHPDTAQLAQEKQVDQAMELLLAMNQRLAEMEAELEKAMQQKQGETAPQPPQTSTDVQVAPTVQTAAAPVTTAAPITATSAAGTTTETTAPAGSSLSMEKLMKEVKELEGQVSEINVTKEKLAKLEASYDKSKRTVAEREREVKALRKTIAELEKKLNFEEVIAETRQMIWTAIGQEITNQWEFIVAIYEQIGLISKAKKELYRARNELGNMADIAPKMIEILNYRNSSQLIQMGIDNRTETISEIKRTTIMRDLIQTLDRRVHDMQADIAKFQNRFTALQDKGLPSLEEAGKLLSYEKYIKRLSAVSAIQDAEAPGSSTAGPLTGRGLFDKLDNLFFIRSEVARLFDKPPNFYKYTEADETIRTILKHQLPHPETWQDLVRLILNQS
jgi:hypothetical protein